jgi:hypothetical protein
MEKPLNGDPQLQAQRLRQFFETGNWRLTFGFFDINAVAVNYEDYH